MDRLGWAAGIAFRAYGLDLGVRVNDPRLLSRVVECLPYGWKASRRPGVIHMYSLVGAPVSQTDAGADASRKLRRFNMLYSESVQVARTLSLDDLFDVFESDVRQLVAEFARKRVFVHAGVVGWRGRAIVIPGRSYSGKTSLVAELVRAGATYYSDEYAVLDARGRVHPFAKPLSIRETGGYQQTDHSAEALGGVVGSKPLRVGCVLVTEYRDGARWTPRPLSAGQSALSLLQNAVAARRTPEFVMQALRSATEDARGFKTKRGEAADVVPRILAALDRE